MKKQIFISIIILLTGFSTIAQVGISATNSPPNSSAMLDVSSTTKGLLIPRMTTIQKNTIASKPTGLMVFDITLNQFSYWNGTAWIDVSGVSAGGNQWSSGTGNIFNTNLSDNVGIGTNSPLRKLHISHVGAVGILLESTSSSSIFDINGFNSNDAVVRFSNQGGGFKWNMRLNGSSDNFEIYNYAGTGGTGSGAITVNKSNSWVGLLNSNPLNKLDVGVAPGFSGNELALGNGTQGMSFSLTPTAAIWYTNTNFAMMPASGIGYLGIGTVNPIAPLHVVARVAVTASGGGGLIGRYISYGGGANVIGYNGSLNPSIVADGDIISRGIIGSYYTITASDNRIKKDFSLSNNSEDLERLKKIEITNYRMKDVATWGNQTFKKVIAQQVESVYPEVINKTKSVIPDIYALAESVVYDVQNKKLSISLLKDYDIKIGDKIELVHPEKGKIQSEVVEVSGKSFTVKDWNYPTDKIFVFGREVNDFRSVDYEALSMLGISAIQALAKENEVLKTKMAKLETQNADFQKLKVRLDVIEANLKSLNNSIIK